MSPPSKGRFAKPFLFAMYWRTISVASILLAQLAWLNNSPAREGFSTNEHGDYVVLIHGLGRTSWSMKRLDWALRKAGYRVINASYPSTRLSIQAVAEEWLGPLLQAKTKDRTAKIHFVTHSMGGIVVRQYLSKNQIENLGAVVMLAPPNHGSELADRFQNKPLYRFFAGPACSQLGTEDYSLPNVLGPANFQAGIIAGDRSMNPLFSAWIPGPDDGKVSVRSTGLQGMQDFILVRHSHTWMMWRKDVAVAVTRFLECGCFELHC